MTVTKVGQDKMDSDGKVLEWCVQCKFDEDQPINKGPIKKGYGKVTGMIYSLESWWKERQWGNVVSVETAKKLDEFLAS